VDVADAHVNNLEVDAGVRRIDRPGGRLCVGMSGKQGSRESEGEEQSIFHGSFSFFLLQTDFFVRTRPPLNGRCTGWMSFAPRRMHHSHAGCQILAATSVLFL